MGRESAQETTLSIDFSVSCKDYNDNDDDDDNGDDNVYNLFRYE